MNVATRLPHKPASVAEARVADAGRGFAMRSRVDRQDEGSGWSLHLVDALSDRWGTERDGRMRIWFELDCGSASAAA